MLKCFNKQLKAVSFCIIFATSTISSALQKTKAPKKNVDFTTIEYNVRVQEARIIAEALNSNLSPVGIISSFKNKKLTNEFKSRFSDAIRKHSSKAKYQAASSGTRVFFRDPMGRSHTLQILETYPNMILSLNSKIYGFKLNKKEAGAFLNFLAGTSNNNKEQASRFEIQDIQDFVLSKFIPKAEAIPPVAIGALALGASFFGVAGLNEQSEATNALKGGLAGVNSGLNNVADAIRESSNARINLIILQTKLADIQISNSLLDAASKLSAENNVLAKQLLQDAAGKLAAPIISAYSPILDNIRDDLDRNHGLKVRSCEQRTPNKVYAQSYQELSDGTPLFVSRKQSGGTTEDTSYAFESDGKKIEITIKERQKSVGGNFFPTDVEEIASKICVNSNCTEINRNSSLTIQEVVDHELMKKNFKKADLTHYDDAITARPKEIRAAEEAAAKESAAQLEAMLNSDACKHAGQRQTLLEKKSSLSSPAIDDYKRYLSTQKDSDCKNLSFYEYSKHLKDGLVKFQKLGFFEKFLLPAYNSTEDLCIKSAINYLSTLKQDEFSRVQNGISAYDRGYNNLIDQLKADWRATTKANKECNLGKLKAESIKIALASDSSLNDLKDLKDAMGKINSLKGLPLNPTTFADIDSAFAKVSSFLSNYCQENYVPEKKETVTANDSIDCATNYDADKCLDCKKYFNERDCVNRKDSTVRFVKRSTPRTPKFTDSNESHLKKEVKGIMNPAYVEICKQIDKDTEWHKNYMNDLITFINAGSVSRKISSCCISAFCSAKLNGFKDDDRFKGDMTGSKKGVQ